MSNNTEFPIGLVVPGVFVLSSGIRTQNQNQKYLMGPEGNFVCNSSKCMKQPYYSSLLQPNAVGYLPSILLIKNCYMSVNALYEDCIKTKNNQKKKNTQPPLTLGKSMIGEFKICIGYIISQLI